MNKKTIALLLALALLASLCACGRRGATQSEAAKATETKAETPAEVGEAAEPATPKAPDDAEAESDTIATPAPTLNWVENDDGSMTATIDNGNGGTANVTMGVVEGENLDDLDDADIDSTPVEVTSAPTATEAPVELPQEPIISYAGPDTSTTLAEYEAMSGTEQTLFYYSFATANDFMEWYNAAKAADDAGKNYIEIGENGIVNAAG